MPRDRARQATYSGVPAGAEDVETAFRGQGLRARDNALGAMDDAPPTREPGEHVRRWRVDGCRGEGHGGES